MYEHFSIAPLEIAEAARPDFDLVWVVDASDERLMPLLPLLRRLGIVIDRSARSEAELVELVAQAMPDGIVTFAGQMVRTSVIAERLGLRFHSPQVAAALDSKLVQRQVLANAGLPGPRFQAVHDDQPCPTDLTVGFPSVLKPQDGLGSQHTYLVPDEKYLREVLPNVIAAQPGGVLLEDLVIEALTLDNLRFAEV